MLHEMQQAFRRAVLDFEDEAVTPRIEANGIAAELRLRIYRNNTFASLVGTLQATFPATHRLMGDAAFRHAARDFIRAAPPTRPQLLAYGSGFPSFLATFPPLGSRPWIGDVARLEWALKEAYFAEDVEPLAPQALHPVAPDRYPQLRFHLHPAVCLVASPYPISRIRAACQAPSGHEATDEAARAGEAEQILVTRPAMTVEMRAVTPGDWALLLHLDGANTLAEAADAAAEAEPGFDLEGALLAHLTHGTFAGFTL